MSGDLGSRLDIWTINIDREKLSIFPNSLIALKFILLVNVMYLLVETICYMTKSG